VLLVRANLVALLATPPLQPKLAHMQRRLAMVRHSALTPLVQRLQAKASQLALLLALALIKLVLVLAAQPLAAEQQQVATY
jgi:hypothetical protein